MDLGLKGLRHYKSILAGITLTIFSTVATWAHAEGTVDVVEYVNVQNGSRVLLVNPGEISAIASGKAGPGWIASGSVFRMFAPLTTGTPVFRFYSPSANSHFYTLSTAEYDVLRRPGSGWTYVGVEFNAGMPYENGGCPVSSPVEIRRYFNATHVSPRSLHRYTREYPLTDLLTLGWAFDGGAFCAVESTNVSTVSQTYRMVLPAAEPESLPLCNESIQPAGAIEKCMRVANQSAPRTRLTVGSAGLPVGSNQTASAFFAAKTGLYQSNVFVAGTQPPLAEAASHSFVQRHVSLCGIHFFISCLLGYDPIGIYVNGLDRSAPLTSIAAVHRFPLAFPYVGTTDARLFPWRGSTPLSLLISFTLDVPVLSRALPDAHAYGHPGIVMHDTVTGRRIRFNLLAYSTDPLPNSAETDYAGFDDDGAVIVSTSFRSNPAIGTRIFGDAFSHCARDAGATCSGKFSFLLRPADIDAIVARARRIEPRLSASLSDYAVERFDFKNEVAGNAEAGVALDLFKLQLLIAD